MPSTTAAPSVTPRPTWTSWHTVILIGLLLLLGVTATATWLGSRIANWVAVMVLLGLSFSIAGQGVTGLWRGLLIDGRNMMSLSRLQTVAWTLVVLSAFLTASLGNVAVGSASPLSIAVPAELWLLMGISATSLVASPIIKGSKKQKRRSEIEYGYTLGLRRAEGVDTDTIVVGADSVLVMNESPKQSRWSDMFRGEEVGNQHQLDIGKLQMFYFTAILLVAYVVQLGHVFATGEPEMTEFPSVDAGFVALLGISHAGYLAYKVAPHSEPKPK